MDFIFAFLTDWIKEGLIEAILKSFNGIFDAVNSQIGETAENIGQTPEEFNNGIFTMIRGLSDTVIIPVAGIILTFVAVYELIQLITEKITCATLTRRSFSSGF